MRLIDADALEKWIADRVKNYHKSFPDWKKTHPISVETALLELDCIKDVVRESPTIDAAPVVHGRWVPVTGSPGNGVMFGCTAYRCSLCGRLEEENGEPYCHCGAKMDGGDHDA